MQWNLTDEPIDPIASYTAQHQLCDMLRDLLLIHWEEHFLGRSHTAPANSQLSLFLHKSEYVSGEKSGARSSMRLTLHLSPDEDAMEGVETVTLEFVVKGKPAITLIPRRL